MHATSTLIVLAELAGNVPPQLNTLQLLLLPHVDTLIIVWKSAWVITAIVVVALYIRAWRSNKTAL